MLKLKRDSSFQLERNFLEVVLSRKIWVYHISLSVSTKQSLFLVLKAERS